VQVDDFGGAHLREARTYCDARAGRGSRRLGRRWRRVPHGLHLSKLAEKTPRGPQWVHEIKLDGFRMAARIERGEVQLLTRSALDWTAKYPATPAASPGSR
jgi:ATP-dependent DNA ligase